MSKFEPRLTIPEKGNKYYITKASGGWNPCIKGKPTNPDCDVLANCVGFAVGRFNEVAQTSERMPLLKSTNAENMVDVAKSQGLTISQTPQLGAVACWAKGKVGESSDGAGHVAIVEKILSDTQIVTSESGYNASKPFWTQTRTKGNGNWGQNSSYTFLGFILNPKKFGDDGYTKPSKSVKKGDTGESVKWVQWKLQSAGYYAGQIDGCFGVYTLGALLAYQFEHGLDVDGVCGPKTRSALSSE